MQNSFGQGQNCGCMIPEACNFDTDAICDDGSCYFGMTDCPEPCNVVPGCMDPEANNFNANANCNIPLLCSYLNAGCSDPDACNYDPEVKVDDGSCDFGTLICPDPCGIIIFGCTDAIACNYNALATCDDASCHYGMTDCPEPCNVVPGCMDPEANNFNPDANCNIPLLCVYFAAGCTDPDACNYDPEVKVDDGSCDYGDLDCPAPCNTIYGCTDPMADNYNSAANCDDESCILANNGCGVAFEIVQPDCGFENGYLIFTSITNDPQGHLFELTTPSGMVFLNYTLTYPTLDGLGAGDYILNVTGLDGCSSEIHFTIEDNCPCIPDGCTDVTASNYDPDATCDDGSCEYGNLNGCGVEFEIVQPACGFSNGHLEFTFINDESQGHLFELTTPSGMVFLDYSLTFPSFDDLGAGDYILTVDGQDDCSSEIHFTIEEDCLCIPDGCIDTNACNFDPNATCDDGSCDFGVTTCPNPCNVVYGCSDTNACNFNPNATCDDGSCDFGITTCPNPCNVVYGCTDTNACNYNPNATCDNGNCNLGVTACSDPCNVIYGCIDTNACDFNPFATCDDGSCNLGVTTCPNPCNVVYGCTDAEANNYNPDATCEDDSCDYTCSCNEDYEPVCANGTTYINACYAECLGITNYTSGACQTICDQGPIFTYTYNEDSNSYCFEENIGIDNICEWNWNFGNGATGDTFQECGIELPYQANGVPYTVCLTITDCNNFILGECCEEIYPPAPYDFPWLEDIIDPSNCCDGTTVYEYIANGYSLVYIEAGEGCDIQTQIYFEDGTLYCTSYGTFSCYDFYNLANFTEVVLFTCDDFPPCICTDEFNPVCGSDGTTYDNACLAECAGVSYTNGDCNSCGVVFNPINPECGYNNGYIDFISANTEQGHLFELTTPNGLTYTNYTLSFPEYNDLAPGDYSLSVIGLNGCQQTTEFTMSENCPCDCSNNYNPVCGVDGVTYHNACLATCAGATIDYNGPCFGGPSDTLYVCQKPNSYASYCPIILDGYSVVSYSSNFPTCTVGKEGDCVQYQSFPLPYEDFLEIEVCNADSTDCYTVLYYIEISEDCLVEEYNCEAQRECTEAITPIILCPDFCAFDGPNADYTLTSIQSFYTGCSISKIDDECFRYIPLPQMENYGIPDSITVIACGVEICDTILYIMDIGGCDTNPRLVDNDESELAEGRFKVYPNPNNGLFYIDLPIERLEVQTISVLDITGKILKSYTILTNDPVNNIQVDLTNIASGMYFVEWRTETQHSTERIIIE